MFWVECTIFFLVIFLGSRFKGISLGLLGGLGLAIFTFILHIQPKNPPYDFLLILTSIAVAVGTVERAGGLAYLLYLAEKVIKKRPKQIMFISPLVTYMLVFLSGTNHVIYAIFPIIVELSKRIGIRPEGPLSISVIAALHANLASPISAPMALTMSYLSTYGFTISSIVGLLFCSTLSGVLLSAFIMSKMNMYQSLDKQQDSVSSPNQMQTEHPKQIIHVAEMNFVATAKEKHALCLFIVGSCTIILLSTFKMLIPSWTINGLIQPLEKNMILALIMLTTAALVMLVCKVQPNEITKSNAFNSIIQALITILGIAWLSKTFIETNKTQFFNIIQNNLNAPWKFSIILLITSAIIASPMATIQTTLCLGIELDISPIILLASIPAANGVFIIPNFPTMLAAIRADDTGSTHMGKALFDHSFMLPGLISTITAILCAFGLTIVFFPS